MRDHMVEEVGHMSWKTFTRALEYVPYAIKLNWRGEPLLHKELPKMVEYAKRKGVLDIRLNTNGMLLDRSTAIALSDAGLDYLIISVDGATKATYESIREGGDFEVLVKNIITTSLVFDRIGSKTRVVIQICEQPKNEFEIPEWKRFFGQYADELRVGKLFDPQGRKGWDVKIPKTCPQPWQRITVDWKGNIYPCPSDYLGQYYIGNVHNMTIKEAWHSPQMTYLRSALKTGGRKFHSLCRNCSSYC